MRCATITLTLLVAAWAGAAEVPEYAALHKKAAASRPAETDFLWQQIPWHIEATAALKAARDEKRAMLVWLAGGRDRDGSPLERC
jgi:hypothetical protein